MKVLFINEVCGTGSHGRICVDLAKEFEAAGNEVKIAYGRDFNVPQEAQKYAVRIGNKLNVYWHALYTRLTDKHGLASKLATRRFLNWAEEYNPDLLWLHNIHGYFINYEMLFAWIKSRPEMQVRWTLHDCWAFTGHCTHFTYAKCDKWKDGTCSNCPEKKQYPGSILFDNSKQNYERKKTAFTGVKNLSLITPSQWLANLVKDSFLCEYAVQVVNNKIDTEIFKSSPSNFREKYCLEDKVILLGVASVWSKRKGLNDFIKLSETLDDNYRIVLVGLNDTIPGIITIPRTESKQELAEIYSAADWFLNLSYEETYPTVNLEAQACGTPVIAYDVGGTRETVYLADSRIIESGAYENIFYMG